MEAKGWNQKELADRADLHPTSIGLLLKSARPNPGIDTIQKLAGAFGLSVSQFIGEVPVADPDLGDYRAAIDAARQHGLTPEQLLGLINTTAGLFAKK